MPDKPAWDTERGRERNELRSPSPSSPAPFAERIAQLEDKLAQLEARVARLETPVWPAANKYK